ncbi:MAG: hypothetical protein AB7F96_05305 [Beijerinckiaceae bacterium]
MARALRAAARPDFMALHNTRAISGHTFAPMGALLAAMTPDDKKIAAKPAGTHAASAPASGKDKRAERLAAALRQNLTRRKAQARGRKAETGDARQANPAVRADEIGDG